MLEDTDSDMLYQNATDGFEGTVELNLQLGLTPMDLTDLFEPFNDSPAFRPRAPTYSISTYSCACGTTLKSGEPGARAKSFANWGSAPI